MRRAFARVVAWGTAMVVGMSFGVFAQCPPEDTPANSYIRTPDFSLMVESASGAVGDVVGVSVALRNETEFLGWGGMLISICHDPAVAELVGLPDYTDEFIALTTGINTYPVDEGAGLPGDHRGHGFFATIDLDAQAFKARFPSDMPVTVMTVYYRLKGKPGDAGSVTFCDGTLKRWQARCIFNDLYTYGPDYPVVPYHDYLPASPINGTLTVRDGPATHPDRPPEPPDVKVYPELPSPEEINFRVRVEHASALPGAKEVPVEIYVAADVEYSAIVIPIDFDERYLRLARAEDHFLTGLVNVDNRDETPGAQPTEGHAIIYSGLGVNSRRLAAEGEEVHAATLYFDILEAAAEVPETRLSIVRVTDSRGLSFDPWIGVNYASGTGTSDPPVIAEVAPISIEDGVLRLGPATFIRGDSNADGRVDLSDAQSTLTFLFLSSRRLPCLDAADADDDGRLNITDAIFTLSYLFLGGPPLPPPGPSTGEDPTPDGLDC